MKCSKFGNILVTIVLYKKRLKKSETFISLEKSTLHILEFIDLFIYDNSPEPQEVEPTEYINIIYLHDPKNPGVSKAYNTASEKAEALNKESVLIIEQDTTLPLEVIDAYSKAIFEIKPEINIISPKLFSGGKMISPCKYILHRGFPIAKISAGNSQIKGYSFLNSGLLLRTEFMRKIGFFDERLFDYSDHDFIFRSAKDNQIAKIIDLELEHGFSSHALADEDRAVQRFIMLARASSYMSKKYHSPFPILWLIARSFKLFVYTKDASYIKIALTEGLGIPFGIFSNQESA